MLRHKIRFDGFGTVDRTKEIRNTVPRFKPAVKVDYARDGDVQRVVDVVLKAKQVQLVAAVGAGKSTEIPVKLSQALGRLVIHVIPFPLAASVLADYLATTKNGDRITYMDDLAADVPPHGVVIVSSGYVHARLARDSFAGVRDAVLYLDEVHESDAATAVLRELAPALQIFSCVVKATATLDPGSAVTPRLPGARSVKTFTKTAVSSWSANDKGMPWSATSIEGNVLICMDRAETRERMRIEYETHGFDVRICTSDSGKPYFTETIRRLKDPNGGIVIVFVDYAHRSSLTIPCLKDLIESGEVAVPSVSDGAPIIKYRAAYDFEVQQFFGRGARLPGESVTLWRSNEAPPKYMCDLESLEGDAANLLYRLQGFRPPINLSVFSYFDGNVPIDIAASMAGDHPLALCPPESLVPWINGDKLLVRDEVKPAFKYSAKGHMRPNVASYHTEYGVERPKTPPPPVPDIHMVTRVDAGALRDYRNSRDSSPSLDTVYTLESEMPDNLSIHTVDNEYQAFAKPKRVAKRVQEERAAAAALAERAREDDRVLQERAAAAAMAERARFDDSESEVEFFPVQARISMDDVPERAGPSRNRLTMGFDGESYDECDINPVPPVRKPTTLVRRMDGVVDRDKGIHRVIRDRQEKGPSVAITDDQLGSYAYYHNMDSAPQHSQSFWRGVHSVLQFGSQPRAKLDAKGLHPQERLYAMRVLVDEYNNSTAVAVGIQRLFTEVSNRPPDDWHGLVNHDDLVQKIDWMTSECTSAQARARLCRDMMVIFMDYNVDIVSPALELEQKVMREMMQEFEKAAVKKDPDKADEYIRMLNKRQIRVAPRRNDSTIVFNRGRK